MSTGSSQIVTGISGVNGVRIYYFSDTVSVKKTTPPNVKTIILQPGESVLLKNEDLNDWKDVSIDPGMVANQGIYEYEMYFEDGEFFKSRLYKYRYNERAFSYEIPPGGSMSINAISGIEGIKVSFLANSATSIEIPVTDIKLSKEHVSLEVGDQAKLIASVVPNNANATLQWTSNNGAIATVDEDGYVVALAEGTANITVSTENGTVTAKMVVTVIQALQTPTDVFVEWPAKFDVAVDHAFSVNFSKAFDYSTIITENVYITDSENNRVPIELIIENIDQNQNASTVILKPYDNYTRGETYTLWIKDVLSKNGEVLKQSIKMDFTIKQ